jgi:hypothetical protein
LIAGTAGRFADRHAIAQNMYDQMHAQQPQATLSQVELVVLLLLVMLVVFGLGLAVGAVAIVHQLRRGRLWARTLLDLVAVILVIGAVGAMVGLASVSGIARLIAGAAAILQAVLAGGAVFLCHRREADVYFRSNGR